MRDTSDLDMPDAAPRAQWVEIDGVRVPFADLDTLIRTKQTGRFQDKADLESLEQVKRLLHP